MQAMPGRVRSLGVRLGLALLMAACAAAMAGCRLGGADAAAPQRITIVDYNIFHGLYDEDPAPNFDRFQDRLTLIAAELARMKPDIVVLQEVVLSPPKGYPDVRATLLAALGDQYKAIFGEAGSENIDEGTVGRMTLTRLPVVSAANRAVFQGRSAHRVTVQTKGGVLDIYNVHLEGPELVGQQKLEITKLLTFIDANGRNQNPVIVTGDFNSRPGDEAITAMKDFGFTDVEAQKADVTCNKQGDPGCTHATFSRIENMVTAPQDARIDYLFAREGADMMLSIVDAGPFMNQPQNDAKGALLWTSDHIGIQATLELSKKK
ncbi:MAG TPA: endonuclease/exonuclease/phosphatase family protein [Dehalococcoidia bacterium]